MAQSVRLEDAVREYLAFRRTDDVKRRTIQNDELFLRALVTETGNIFVRSIDVVHIQRLFAAKEDSWSVATRNIVKVHLNGFFIYCRSRGWLARDKDPVKPFKRRKPMQREHVRVPATRFSELLEAADHPRDRAFIAVGLYLFLRPSETVTLTLRDVDLDAGFINVTVHKTNTRDRMPISLELEEELRSYLTWYATHHVNMEKTWFLTPAKVGGNFGRSEGTGRFVAVEEEQGSQYLRPASKVGTPEKIVQEALCRLGYPTVREGGHTLRRSGARAYFDQLCADGYSRALKRVSAMLHHDSVATTEKYLGLDVDIEERDTALRGKPMFPQLRAANVVSLKEIIQPAVRGHNG